MRFARRLLIVCLVAIGIISVGWGLKHIEPIDAYFQKGGPPDGQEGGQENAGQVPKEGEAGATPGDDTNRPPKEDEPPRDETSEDRTGESASDPQANHPAGEAKDDDGAHEQWPALNFDDAGHAALWILPTAAIVIVIDLVRRKRRGSITPARAQAP